MFRYFNHRTVALGLMGLGLGATAFGAGFQVQNQSVRSSAMANAGVAASAEDASTIFYNPAGMTYLDRQFVQNVVFLSPKFRFIDDGDSTNAIGGEPLGRTTSNGGGAVSPIFIPSGYLNWPLSERFYLGLGLNGPYGNRTEYDDDWIGRYHAVQSEIFPININPSVAYRVNEQWSLGAGVNISYIDAELDQAVDFGTLGFLAGIPGVSPSDPRYDGFSKLTGDAWGWGFNLGAIFEPRPGTRVGLSYRSQVEFEVEGEQKLDVPNFAVPLAGPSRKRDASADITVPDTVHLSVYHDINPQWAVMADIQWTHWSDFEELRVEIDEPGASDSVQPEDWEDTWRVSVGTRYRLDEHWSLRGGIAWDQEPIPSDLFRTPRLPGDDRWWFSTGATYRFSDSLEFDAFYTYVFIDDYGIDNTEVATGDAAGLPVGSTLDGDYESDAHIFGASVLWRF